MGGEKVLAYRNIVTGGVAIDDLHDPPGFKYRNPRDSVVDRSRVLLKGIVTEQVVCRFHTTIATTVLVCEGVNKV